MVYREVRNGKVTEITFTDEQLDEAAEKIRRGEPVDLLLAVAVIDREVERRRQAESWLVKNRQLVAILVGTICGLLTLFFLNWDKFLEAFK